VITAWEFIKALPAIFAFFRQVRKWVHQERDAKLRQAKLQVVTNAFQQSTQAGNTNAIENLFKPPGS